MVMVMMMMMMMNRLNRQQAFISVRSLPLCRKQPSFLEEMKLYCMPPFSAPLAHYSPFLVGILFTKWIISKCSYGNKNLRWLVVIYYRGEVPILPWKWVFLINWIDIHKTSHNKYSQSTNGYGVIDGNLCESFSSISQEKQEEIANGLGLSISAIIQKMEELRSRVL